MKKSLRKLVALMLAFGLIFSCTPVMADEGADKGQEIENGGLKYYINKSAEGAHREVSVSELGENNSEKEITIPSSIRYSENDYDVTAIGAGAFLGCEILEKITIPSTVKKIGEEAFFNCNKLTNITIPGTVKKIGDDAFSGCIILSDVEMKEGTEEIGAGAFFKCIELKNINIPSTVKKIGEEAFNGTKIRKIIIPRGVTIIEYGTFWDCTELENVNMQGNVTEINKLAFKSCTELDNVVIPNSVELIGTRAFEGCSNLKKITIPNNVKWINIEAFKSCESLDKVVFNGTSAPKFYSDCFRGVGSSVEEGAKAYVPFKSIDKGNFPYVSNEYPFNEDGPLQLIRACTVTFQDKDGKLIEEQTIEKGQDAIDPTPPIINGYDFIKWEGNYNNIQNDVIVKAIYKEKIFDKPTTSNNQTTTDTTCKIITEQDNSIEGLDTTTFDATTILQIKVVTGEIPTQKKENYKSSINEIAKGKEIKELYDIKLLLNGLPIQPSGSVKVKIKLTKEQMKLEQMQIVYIDDNDKSIVIPHEIKDGFITFTTTHFSNYAIIGNVNKIAKVKPVKVTSVPKTADTTPVYLAIVSLVVLLATVALIVIKRKYQK